MKTYIIAATLLLLSACQTVPPCSVSVQDDSNKVYLALEQPAPLDLSTFKAINLVDVKEGNVSIVQMSEDDYTKLNSLINILSGRIELLQDNLTAYHNYYEKPVVPVVTPAK